MISIKQCSSVVWIQYGNLVRHLRVIAVFIVTVMVRVIIVTLMISMVTVIGVVRIDVIIVNQ